MPERDLTSAYIARRWDVRKKTAASLMKQMAGAYRLHGETGTWRISSADFERYISEQQALARIDPKSYRILLVPDDPEDIALVEEALDGSPFQTRLFVALDKKAALAHVEQRHPDVAIIDLGPLGASGMPLLKAMQPFGIHTVAFFSNCEADQSEFELAMQLGAAFCFSKGKDSAEFIATVAGIIEGLAAASQIVATKALLP